MRMLGRSGQCVTSLVIGGPDLPQVRTNRHAPPNHPSRNIVLQISRVTLFDTSTYEIRVKPHRRATHTDPVPRAIATVDNARTVGIIDRRVCASYGSRCKRCW